MSRTSSQCLFLERIGRWTWASYVILSSPLALFILTLTVVALWSGSPIWREVSMDAFLLLSHPLAWIVFLLAAHRFDRSWWRLLPYLANLASVVFIIVVGNQNVRDDDDSEPWLVAYLVVLALLLILGAIAAASAAFLTRRQEMGRL